MCNKKKEDDLKKIKTINQILFNFYDQEKLREGAAYLIFKSYNVQNRKENFN